MKETASLNDDKLEDLSKLYNQCFDIYDELGTAADSINTIIDLQ